MDEKKNAKTFSYFGNSRSEKNKIRLDQLTLNSGSISYVQLIRRQSKVEKNRCVMRNLKVPKQKLDRNSLSNTLCDGSLVLTRPPMKTTQTHLRNSSNSSVYSKRPDTKANASILRSNSYKLKQTLLNIYERSEKLNVCMEKLGSPFISIDESLLWSKGVRKRSEFFNNSVYNSCSVKILNLSTLH